ncbi:type I methionyl aminopeptidase [Boudabousia liubingyangii]|uniref:Methionine aminopeptidase n=1 Tax=Boudabousia liubingyangii TaxID=1921764 RepID=A0A1Q5PQG0_9ACTO|nr:type I methionyl aminopeptidase [Boudabousia liubingyangii]OKL49733.1 type I methionyl aminopeptidase [Boudabousia liubingyangii]
MVRFRDKVNPKMPKEIGFMREAGLVVAKIHQALREAAKPGMTTGELDQVCRDVIKAEGAKSNFLNYHGFPATVCISVNDEIVHGIPGSRKLEAGDLVKFDCGAYVNRENKQWHGDAAFSMIIGGEEAGSQTARELNEVTQTALYEVIRELAKGAQTLNAVGDTVEMVVAERAIDYGWEAGIVEEYVGHGIGNAMHEAPDVYNYSVRGKLMKLRPGQVFAIEPMLTAGDPDNSTDDDGWTVRTKDGSLACQWEHTVAIMPGGVWVLTALDGGAEILAPAGLKPVTLPGVVTD